MRDGLPSYPDKLEIRPLLHPLRWTVTVPGSKSITNRALVLAALACGEKQCDIRGALRSEDTEVCIAALRQLGFQILAGHCETPTVIEVVNPCPDRIIPADRAELFVANSGTTMRFLTAIVSLGHGRYRLDGISRMRERPIEDLLSALRQLGVEAYSEGRNGCPPVVVNGNGLGGGKARVKGNLSSQYLSGLLMAVPLAAGSVRITVEGPLVSWPYVEMTLSMMARFGVQPTSEHVKGNESEQRITFPGSQRYDPLPTYDVEPDASAASYFYGAAAVCGGEVCVAGLGKDSIQGDIRFIRLLEEMGCDLVRSAHGLAVRGGPLRGIDVDMNDISDTVMTLAVVACFAEGPTTIRNVAHIRHKETDRLAALATELRRVGADVDEFPDGLKITPRPLHGAEIETYHDHRMAMSMALVGLRIPGVVIKDPACVAKTYPRFFEDLEKLRC
jgi:3-phosphoshikimate 1-carboxyvinyltransferase